MRRYRILFLPYNAHQCTTLKPALCEAELLLARNEKWERRKGKGERGKQKAERREERGESRNEKWEMRNEKGVLLSFFGQALNNTSERSEESQHNNNVPCILPLEPVMEYCGAKREMGREQWVHSKDNHLSFVSPLRRQADTSPQTLDLRKKRKIK